MSASQGKMLCLLPKMGQYTSCPPQMELPNPMHYEATYRAPFFHDYDDTGAPIKSYNDRYPQPPKQKPRATPAPGSS